MVFATKLDPTSLRDRKGASRPPLYREIRSIPTGQNPWILASRRPSPKVDHTSTMLSFLMNASGTHRIYV